MGRDKAALPVGPETMLGRVVRIVGEAVPAENILCVAAPDQPLPPLPPAVRIVCDSQPHQGPLAGLATGLLTSRDGVEAVFVTGCDAPLLTAAFISRMFELRRGHEIAAPHDGERWHPLAAVYSTRLLPKIESLLASGARSLVALLESADTRRVPPAELRAVDAQLASLVTCNTPAEYEAALTTIDSAAGG